MGNGVLSSGVKEPRHEGDHSRPSSAEVKNVELDLHSPMCLHGMLRDKFTFTFIVLFLMVVLVILDTVKGDMTVAKFESTTALNFRGPTSCI